ncbi:MAG: hypothetical protein ACYTFY_09955 [Planctomycetota bacterium]|jgi:hypothetical protein
MLANKHLEIACNNNLISLKDKLSGEVIEIRNDSIGIINSGVTEPFKATDISEYNNCVEITGSISDSISAKATLQLKSDNHWCTINSEFTNSDKNAPTPDAVILAGSESLTFEAVGYKVENAYAEDDGETTITVQEGEEASGGKHAGCGYPVFSENFFAGVEHVSAYTLKNDSGFTCRYYPTWKDGTIKAPAVVIGTKAGFRNIEKAFLNYIDKIAIPKKQESLLCCCTFWSDPYLGNCEYKVNFKHYDRYMTQFLEAGIKPDMLMLDAGWNNRNSIFQAKSDIGGDEGLKKISDYLKDEGIRFGLWCSINGTMGVSHEWAEQQGYPTGTGIGAAYSSPNEFVVMMDNDFGKKMAERYTELIEKTDCEFFKIDWDCECATNESFNEKYPTHNHVRTASIDAFNEIHNEVIQKDKNCFLRNGWWPSPWFLKDVQLTWLANSGDCEYAALPSLTQRDRETTHRDAMYYYIFKKYKTPLPLDSLDNHEISKAYRNPYSESFDSWCSSVILLFMRGTIYQSVMLNAATMTQEEADFFADVKRFADSYKHLLYNKSAQFIGGNPADGEVYGFLHQNEKEAIAVIRNPAIIPQEFDLNTVSDDIDFTPSQTLALYPYCGSVPGENKLELTSHELQIIYFRKEAASLPEEIAGLPFLISKDGSVSLPAGLEPDDSFGTIQEDFVMVRDIKIEDLGEKQDNSCTTRSLKIYIPDRMIETRAIFELNGGTEHELDKTGLRLYHDRYEKTGDGHAIAGTILYSKRKEGFGLERNRTPEQLELNKQYRLFNLPTGGEFFLEIEIDKPDNIKNLKVNLFVEGKRDKSRKSKKLDLPEIFNLFPKIYKAGLGRFQSFNLLD